MSAAGTLIRDSAKREPGLWDGGRLVAFAPLGPYPVGAEWFFARWCALECMHLWTPPAVVRQYLESGDPYLADSTRRERTDAAAGFSRARRATAARIAWWPQVHMRSRYTWVVEHDPSFEGARLSAAYSALGNIDGAAEWSMRALAWEARETARKADPQLPISALAEAQKKAKQKLQQIFRDTALQIYRSERYA